MGYLRMTLNITIISYEFVVRQIQEISYNI